MKNNINKLRLLSLILIAGIVSIFTSCKKELESKLYSQLTPENFYKSEADANAALITLYVPFTSNWDHAIPGGQGGRYAGFYNADIKTYLLRSIACTDEFGIDWDANLTNFTWGANTWSGTGDPTYYEISYVARATQIIDDISKTTLADATKKTYIAQAKTLRAWIMYILYDFYGPVNAKTDPATLIDSAQMARPTAEAYCGQIEKDLTEALPDLKDKYNADAANWGRVSKGVARMVLLKLYMQNKQWAKAEAVGKDIIGMGYSLLTGPTGYASIFTTKANNELIYAVPANDATPNFWAQEVLPSNFKSATGIPARSTGWGGGYMPWTFYDKYEAGDLRKTTIIDNYIKTNNSASNRANGLRGAIPLKYTAVTGNGPGFPTDVVVFRYAEVLLSVAEAINEQRGPADAYQYVNQVRSRAGVLGFSGMTAADFRTALLDERGRELYSEGTRRQDLIRNGTFISNAIARGKTNAQPYMTVYPIPNAVILAGKGVIIQNPNY